MKWNVWLYNSLNLAIYIYSSKSHKWLNAIVIFNWINVSEDKILFSNMFYNDRIPLPK